MHMPWPWPSIAMPSLLAVGLPCPQGVIGLPNIDAFQDTKEEFVFGSFSAFDEDAMMAEMQAYGRAMDDGGEFREEEASGDGLPFQARASPNEHEEADAFEAAFQSQHPDDLKQSMLRLKPSHRWLAMHTRLYRPTLSPQHPTVPELQVARDIRHALGQEGCEMTSSDFNSRFQQKWLQACRGMSLGEREEKHIGLIAPGGVDIFLKQYKKWSMGKLAREHIKEADNNIRDLLRSSERDAPQEAAPTTSAPTTPGFPIPQPPPSSQPGAFLQPPLAMHDHAQVLHAPFDPSKAHVPSASGNPPPPPAPPQAPTVSYVCFECGWPRNGPKKALHKRGARCAVAPGDRNPDLLDIRKTKKRSYTRFCKANGITPQFE